MPPYRQVPMHAWVRQIKGVNFYRRGNQLVSRNLIVRSSPPSVLLVFVLLFTFYRQNSIQFNSTASLAFTWNCNTGTLTTNNIICHERSLGNWNLAIGCQLRKWFEKTFCWILYMRSTLSFLPTANKQKQGWRLGLVFFFHVLELVVSETKSLSLPNIVFLSSDSAGAGSPSSLLISVKSSFCRGVKVLRTTRKLPEN